MSDSIQLELSKDEFRTLLESAYIADWVMHANTTPEEHNPDTAPHRELLQRIFARASDAGCADMVEYDKEAKTYGPSEKLEFDGLPSQIVEEYENDSMWTGLAEALAWRTLHRKYGKVGLKRMKEQDRMALYGEEYDHALKEFAENGLENFELVPFKQDAAKDE